MIASAALRALQVPLHSALVCSWASLAFGLFLCSRVAIAQGPQASSLLGEKARVTTVGERVVHVGYIHSLDSTTLVLRPRSQPFAGAAADSRRTSFPLSALQTIEIRKAESYRIGGGLVGGALIGVLAGGAGAGLSAGQSVETMRTSLVPESSWQYPEPPLELRLEHCSALAPEQPSGGNE